MNATFPVEARADALAFWTGLDRVSTEGGLLADWEWAFGSALDLVRPFLRCTGEASVSFPCPAHPECACRRHDIVETDRWGLVAACHCGECEHPRWRIRPEDRLVHELDWHRFAGQLRQALGLGEPRALGRPGFGELREVGRFAGLASVYVSLADGDLLLRSLLRLFAAQSEPVVLLTARGVTCTPEVFELLRREGGAHLALCDVVAVGPDGTMTGLGDPASRLARGLGANGRGVLAHTVEQIGRDLAAIARNRAKEPPREAKLDQGEASRIFRLMKLLESEPGQRKAAPALVFRLVVLEGLSQKQAAARCRCVKSLISARVQSLESRFGLTIERLRAYATMLGDLEATVRGDRRRRKTAGRPDDFDRPELVATPGEETDDGEPDKWGNDS
jgi:hypothetical protein